MDETTLALVVLAAMAVVVLLLAFSTGEGTVSPASWLRAKRLFLSRLDEPERRLWLRENRLVVSAASGRQYTLTPYASFNIYSGDDTFCLRVEGRIPPYDKLLAQLLLLRTDEQTFLRTANTKRRLLNV